jgi:hypothetical protein
MGVVLPQRAKVQKLRYISGNAFRMKGILWVNNYTPTDTTVLGDLTEATFAGYSQQSISFGTPSIDGSGRGQMVMNPITFTAGSISSPVSVYGVAIVDYDSEGAVAMWVQRFDSAPITLSSEGSNIVYNFTDYMQQGS